MSKAEPSPGCRPEARLPCSSAPWPLGGGSPPQAPPCVPPHLSPSPYRRCPARGPFPRVSGRDRSSFYGGWSCQSQRSKSPSGREGEASLSHACALHASLRSSPTASLCGWGHQCSGCLQGPRTAPVLGVSSLPVHLVRPTSLSSQVPAGAPGKVLYRLRLRPRERTPPARVTRGSAVV